MCVVKGATDNNANDDSPDDNAPTLALVPGEARCLKRREIKIDTDHVQAMILHRDISHPTSSFLERDVCDLEGVMIRM